MAYLTPPERAVRLLRAKAAELESYYVQVEAPEFVDHLAADIALIASLLADYIEGQPT